MDAKDKVKRAIIEALQNCASEGFKLSQSACPVKTGQLKKSGKYELLPEGSTINYAAEYASIVERGRTATKEYVRGHTINGHLVRAYTRNVKPRLGVHFIEGSLKKAFAGFADGLDGSLRGTFERVIRR